MPISSDCQRRSARSTKVFLMIVTYLLSLLAQEHYAIVTCRTAADKNRVTRAGSESWLTPIGPSGEVGGRLHLIGLASLRVPDQEQALRRVGQLSHQPSARIQRIASAQKYLIKSGRAGSDGGICSRPEVCVIGAVKISTKKFRHPFIRNPVPA